MYFMIGHKLIIEYILKSYAFVLLLFRIKDHTLLLSDFLRVLNFLRCSDFRHEFLPYDVVNACHISLK